MLHQHMNHNPSLLHELLMLWEDRQQNGERTPPEELCRDCPDLLEPLRRHIAMLQEVDRRFGIIQAETNAEQIDTTQPSEVEILPADRLKFETEFVLRRFHARGGLGAVYIARDLMFQRDVAVKFARRQRLSPVEQARFRREAEITGRLEHPGIVPVYAMTPAGQEEPCFVMRWLDGETLQGAIEQLHSPADSSPIDFHGIRFRGLLQRFVSICNTAAFAHEQGVVHRDVKPSNIMLGPFGETILLDWGLAKSLGEVCSSEGSETQTRANGSSDVTRPGDILGTFAFASPDQLSGNPDDLDSRSDVFSLGATLYALLTGTPPFSPTSDGPSQHPLNRGAIVGPRKRTPAVPRSLEAICLKAMSVEKANRYASAKGLAEDIEHFLADEPVTARVEPFAARCLRFARRHHGLAAATSATMLVGMLALTIGAALLGHKNRQLGQLNHDVQDRLTESRANLNLAVSTVDQFCTNVSEDLRMQQADLNPLRQRLLGSAVAFHQELLKRRGGSPLAHRDLADSYGRLAWLSKATDSNERAIELYRNAIQEYRIALRKSPRDAKICGALIQALAASGRLLAETAQADLAKAFLDESIALAHELVAWDPTNTTSRIALADALIEAEFSFKASKEYEKAESVLHEAVAECHVICKADPHSTEHRWRLANTCLSLGELHLLKGLRNWREAEAAALQAQDIAQELVKQSPESPSDQRLLAKSQYLLGILYKVTARAEDSRAALTRAIAIQESLGQQFPSVTDYSTEAAESYRQLGNLERIQGRVEVQQSAYQKAAEIFQRLARQYPDNYLRESQLADVLSSLAEIARDRGDAQFALGYSNQAVEIFENILAKDPAFANAIDLFPDALATRASILTDVAKYREALSDWDRVLAISKDSYLTPWRKVRRARTLVHLARHAEATQSLAESLPEVLRNCNGHQRLELLVLAARIYGQACLEANFDNDLNPADRQVRINEYRQSAIDLIQRARGAGMTLEEERNLRQGPEFELLRQTEEFRELLPN